MAEFKAITTQEEFDQAISERLKREKETQAKKYADYEQLKEENASLKEQIGELNHTVDELTSKSKGYDEERQGLCSKIKSYEDAALKSRIAHEMGIPYELAGRLSGEDEKTLREDAKTLSQFFNRTRSTQPLKSTEPKTDEKDSAYKALLEDLKGE